MERLNKYIAECGVASRRAADKLIEEGVVKVNGKVVDKVGFTVDEDSVVSVNDKIINKSERTVYIMFNKPKRCVTTLNDEKGRKTVYDYIDISERVYPIGRLDYDSEGLLLLTNDGDLTYRLTHPSHEVGKTYIAKVEGEVPENDLALFRKGIELDGKKTARAKIKLLEFKENISKFEITIFEGRNRQIRRMFSVLDKEVIFLKRTAIGSLKLGGLSRGGWRYLNDAEISYLQNI